MKYIKHISYTALAILPAVTLAAPGNLIELKDLILGYLLQIIPIVVLLIVLFFIYGIADFIRKSGEGDNIAEAKKRIVWGVVAIFITFSFWGIVTLLTSDFFGKKPGFGAPQIDSEKVEGFLPRNDSLGN